MFLSVVMRVFGVLIVVFGVLFVLVGLIPSESSPDQDLGMAIFGGVLSGLGAFLFVSGRRRSPATSGGNQSRASGSRPKRLERPGTTSRGPSDRVVAILLEKTDIPEREIQQLSEAEAWRIVYSLKNQPKPHKTEICFTGFRPAHREDLEEIAIHMGLQVRKSVTQNLNILVAGDNPGPTKLETAQRRGNVIIMNESEYLRFTETGEVP